MPVPSTIADLSTTAGSNYPQGTDTPTTGDDTIRALSSFIAVLRDLTNGTSTGASLNAATFSGLLTLNATNLKSGTYTPTLTNVSNISASTARQCQYLRVGNVVTVTGQFDATHSATGTVATEVGISLPVASAFTTAYQCGGAATSFQAPASGFVNAQSIEADATNDRARVRWANAAISGSVTYTFTFSYEVI